MLLDCVDRSFSSAAASCYIVNSATCKSSSVMFSPVNSSRRRAATPPQPCWQKVDARFTSTSCLGGPTAPIWLALAADPSGLVPGVVVVRHGVL